MTHFNAVQAGTLGLCWLDDAALADAVWRFDLLPLAEARRRQVLPLQWQDRPLLLLGRPFDLAARQWAAAQPGGWQLAAAADGVVEAQLAAAGERQRVLDEIDWSDSQAGGGSDVLEITRQGLSRTDSPVIRLIDSTLFDALTQGASDVHLEAQPGGLGIRLRIDGSLQHAGQAAGAELAAQAISRLKILSGLDIGERRVPQDGRFSARIEGREIDVRVSIVPGVRGEDAVLRLLDTGQMAERLSLERLGIVGPSAAALRALAARPHGMLLVTGPTGSGKTTTLYATLGEFDRSGEKLVTIEDPVEYQLPDVLQIPVNERKGLTFARGLRAVLRHDPDTILVGEIRDGETAAIAVQAALTGHRVLSSIHANGVFGVIERFRFLAVEPATLAEALNGVLAQRLVRRVCPQCARPAGPDARVPGRLGIDPSAAGRLQAGSGCDRCHGSGFHGRLALVETLRFDRALRAALARGAPPAELRTLAGAGQFRPLVQDAAAAVLRGETTCEEVLRVLDDE